MLPAGGETSAEEFARILRARSALLPVALDARQQERLAAYLALLDRARRSTNLTGPIPPEALADHALESIFASPFLPEGARVVDVGSGAGFPGIPLAIGRPDATVTLVEPRRKRREFLDAARSSLSLVNVVPPVATTAALPEGASSACVTRAVGGIGGILGRAPFLGPGGLLLAWTTDAAMLSRALDRRFVFETSVPIPRSERKAIAAYRAA
jgi:16S rRNA (guanine(527)-N(7))-methyltransferase RsmG